LPHPEQATRTTHEDATFLGQPKNSSLNRAQDEKSWIQGSNSPLFPLNSLGCELESPCADTTLPRDA